MKFIHAADIHLDSPLRGLARYDGAPLQEIRSATRRALENLVQLCLDETVDLLLIAGDLYDGDWRDYNTGLFFVHQMARLSRANIPVVLIRGNHDAASQLSKSLRLPRGVHELSTRKPETCRFERLNVAVHGQGYRDRDIQQDLSEHYPNPLPDCFNIGLLHTAVDGRAGHDLYAPCSVPGLIAKGYQYWALGHVHQREILCQDPWILFPGNLQGRHARETGAKGATLVTLEDNTVTALEHRELDVVRWALCTLDASTSASAHDLVEQVREQVAQAADNAQGRLLAVRLEITGASSAHTQLASDPEGWEQQVRAAVADLDDSVWIEKIRFNTRSPLDLDALLSHDDPLAGLIRGLRELGQDPAGLVGLSQDFNDLKTRLPPEYQQLEDALKLDDPATLAELLSEVEQLLIPRLLTVREQT